VHNDTPADFGRAPASVTRRDRVSTPPRTVVAWKDMGPAGATVRVARATC
jgi:hypothetical protein